MFTDDDITLANRPTSLRGYDAKAWSDVTGIDTGDQTLVQQQFANEVDINTIVRRFGITGSMPFGQASPGVYGDFTEISDYESAMERVRKVDEGFMRLPPEVRERWDNDPGKLIRFANQLTEEDLSVPPAEPAPVVTEPVS